MVEVSVSVCCGGAGAIVLSAGVSDMVPRNSHGKTWQANGLWCPTGPAPDLRPNAEPSCQSANSLSLPASQQLPSEQPPSPAGSE